LAECQGEDPAAAVIFSHWRRSRQAQRS